MKFPYSVNAVATGKLILFFGAGAGTGAGGKGKFTLFFGKSGDKF